MTDGGPADGRRSDGPVEDGERSNTPADGRLPSVCVVTHPLGAAGENATRTLLEILAAITRVSLVTADLPDDSVVRDRHEVIELSDRGPGESIPRAAVGFARNQVRMCRAIARRDDEVVLFFGATAYLLPILFARAIGRTVVLEPRGNVPLTLRLGWERRLPSPVARGLAGVVWSLERVGYWAADAIITYTPSMARELGLERFEGKLYPNGARYVDTDRFAPRIPFEERDEVVGFLGRLDEEKNVRLLAQVAKELPDGVTFRFVGDGPLRGELERTLADEVAAGRVEFTGWVEHDRVPAELSQLRLLVLPSEPTEGLPTVILESMACGTPVLASPVSGVPDVVQDGKTGYLLTDGEPSDIAASVSAILSRPDSEDVSRASRKTIRETFDFTAATERYWKILKAITSEG